MHNIAHIFKIINYLGGFLVMMVPFGYKRFVSLANVFQGFIFNLKEVVQIQWLRTWVISHWI